MLLGSAANGAVESAKIDECRLRCRRGGVLIGAVCEFRAPDVKVGLRFRFIPTEGGDALAARGMSCQVIALGCFFLGLKFPLVHVPLSAVALRGDCAGMTSR